MTAWQGLADMSNKTHILVISQYFYPEQFRINDICSEWVRRGYEVTVVTGMPNYPQGKFYEGYGYFKKRKENYNGVEIIRLPIIPRGHSSVMMALNYLSFIISGFFWAKFTSLKADKVFTYEVSPMTQALVGIWYAKRRNIPSILYVMDLWPENVRYAGGIKNKKILALVGKVVDYIYRNSDVILTSSRSFISAIKERGFASCDISFWPQYAEEWYKPMSQKAVVPEEIPDDGVFNIVFAGNIGVAQGLEILPKCACVLKTKNIKARFNVIGDGRFKETLQTEVINNGVTEYFNFIAKKPATDIPKYLSACDAALVSLAPNEIFRMTLPAKLQTYFACGIPVLVCADGESQEVVKNAQAGIAVDAGDYIGFADAIEKMCSLTKEELSEMGENARRYFESHFEKQKLLNQIDAIFAKAGHTNV